MSGTMEVRFEDEDERPVRENAERDAPVRAEVVVDGERVKMGDYASREEAWSDLEAGLGQ